MWVSTWNGGITKFELTPNAVGDVWSYKPVTIVPTVIRSGDAMSILNPSRQTLKSFELFTEDGRLLANHALNSNDELQELRTPSLIQGKYVGRVVGSNRQVHTSFLIVN